MVWKTWPWKKCRIGKMLRVRRILVLCEYQPAIVTTTFSNSPCIVYICSKAQAHTRLFSKLLINYQSLT
jgi:hypothetical protein